MEAAATKTILRIELWHVLCLLMLLVAFGWSKLIEPTALLLGGVFMGVNFLLLSYGVAWLLTPLASNRRIKAGVALLVIKIIIFLGVLTTVFFRFDLDAISFAVGFSTLILAILVEAIRRSVKLRT
jgi:Kef-type K+ transport system membrane component KefB